MARVRTVVFDAGGTLIYPADPVGETYARFAKAHGVRMSADAANVAFYAAMKNGSPREKGKIPANGDDRAWWKKIVRASLPSTAFPEAKAFDAFFEDVHGYFAKPDAWGVYPEVVEVLEELRDRGIDTVVLSNWDSRLHPVLDGHGLGEVLSQRFISTELGWEKPDAAIYRHVAETLRQPPESLLSVGDDARNDVEGPRRAGWQAVQVERPKRDLWAAVRAVTKR